MSQTAEGPWEVGGGREVDAGGGTERSPTGRSAVPAPASGPPVGVAPEPEGGRGPELPAAAPAIPAAAPVGAEGASFPDETEFAEPPPEPELRIPRLGAGPKHGRPLAKPHSVDAKAAVLTAAQRLLILDTWRRSGLPAGDFAELVGVSKHTLYAWKKKFEEQGPGGLADRPKGHQGSRLPDLTRRSIIMLKQDHPDWGCQRISDVLLRGPGLAASPNAVARVLHEEGYESVEQPTEPHPDKVRSFERAKPNQLWQSDLFTFLLKRQNRRVYLVAFMDDHSRFIVSYGLHASQSAALVMEVLRAGITSYGTPQEVLTDNGSQYVTWRGTSAFARELQRRGIQHVVASPRHPQTLGKVERFWGTLWRECLEAAVFLDMADAQRRIGHFVDYYNFRRPHQGLDGLVPADRFFQAAPQIKETLRARVAANALELARNGLPKAAFYLTGQAGGKAFSVHAEGERVIMTREGSPSQEVDLVPPTAPSETMPAPLCPQGVVASEAFAEESMPPGASPLDEGMGQIARSLEEPPSSEGGRP
jgi:transposase InsO family protein